MEAVNWTSYDEERVKEAAESVIKYIDPVMLHFIENCVSCAACEPACPYYAVGEEYGPVNKAENFRKLVRSQVAILPRLFPWLFHAGIPKTSEELNKWAEMAYRCTNCGLCYVTCPFGIHSGEMIKAVRSFLTKTGRVPTILKAMIDMEISGMYAKIEGFQKLWSSVLEKAKEAAGGELPLDKKGAKYLYLPSLAEAMITPEAIVASAKILSTMGLDWTMPSDPMSIRAPVGALAGDGAATEIIVKKIYKYIKEIGPEYVVLSDGGYPYTTFRFDLPHIVGEKPSFKVIHFVELILEAEKKGLVKIKKGDERITWHSPCKMGRFAGLIEEPAEVLSQASTNFKKLASHGLFNKCCGGGNSIACIVLPTMEFIGKLTGMQMQISKEELEFLKKLEHDMHIAGKAKIDEIRETGAKIVATACVGCIHTIRMNAQVYGLDVEVKNIVEVLADKIEKI